MASEEKPQHPKRPPVDEWGIYDPQQAGLAAVIQKVKERRLAAGLPVDEPPKRRAKRAKKKKV